MKHKLIYHSKVPTHSFLAVYKDSGDTLSLVFEALSKDALRTTCDRASLEQIMPVNKSSHNRKRYVEAEFALPGKQDKDSYIRARCEVYSVRRLSKDKYQLLLRFEAMTEQAFLRISHFIDRTHKNRQHTIARVA